MLFLVFKYKKNDKYAIFILCHLGMLSGWMRYPGYYLAGHTRRQEFSMATVDTCWEACLQETSFSCLAVAYSGVESQTCRLYDKRALSVLGDWTSSAEFTYYEYCADGGWHNCLCSSLFDFLIFYTDSDSRMGSSCCSDGKNITLKITSLHESITFLTLSIFVVWGHQKSPWAHLVHWTSGINSLHSHAATRIWAGLE